MLNILRSLSVAALCAFSATLFAAKVGEPAPAFTLTDLAGNSHSLSDFKGKTVVLEWFNSKCPFVVKHYSAGDMQKLQKEFTSQGVVWLLVNSTNTGHKDFLDTQAAQANFSSWEIAATALLGDADGKVGKAYDARTTPHMYVINPEGILVYAGAIDSIRSTRQADVAKAENYVSRALSEVLSGKPVSLAVTDPYGCSVKY
jgi:peroxiredoxin